jgi:acyl-CoA dehydrogenase
MRLAPVGEPPSDRLGSRVAATLRAPGAQRDRLTSDLFVPGDPGEALGRLERAFVLVSEAAPLTERIVQASRAGRLPRKPPEELLDEAAVLGIISPAEAERVRQAVAARADAIQVDSFSLDEYLGIATAPERPEAVA